jgi:hypothetical protein
MEFQVHAGRQRDVSRRLTTAVGFADQVKNDRDSLKVYLSTADIETETAITRDVRDRWLSSG